MEFYNTYIDRNSKKDVSIYITDEVSLDVTVICGKNEGKTLVLTSAVHGCEYVGVKTLMDLKKELEPERMSGNVIIIPFVNKEGFLRGEKRIVPYDGKNLNRVFPANENGTVSEKIAYAIEKYIYPKADFLADLHSGDINERLTSFIFFSVSAEESVSKIGEEGAKSMSFDYRVASTSKNGLYSYAGQKGIPSLLLERGQQGLWSDNEVTAYKKNMYELMSHLGIIEEKFEKPEQKRIDIAKYIEAPCDSLWYPYYNAGDKIKKGDILGEIKDLEDNTIEKYIAEFDGIVLYNTTSLGVKEKDSLVSYGKL